MAVQIKGKKGDWPAFPRVEDPSSDVVAAGMSYREHLAAMFLHGLLAGHYVANLVDTEKRDWAVEQAVDFADRLIARLAKTEESTP